MKRGIFERLLIICVVLGVAQAVLAREPAPYTRKWKTLAEDGIHDPANPRLHQLQEPEEALSLLPKDSAGNQVRWVQALQEGYINPATSILRPTEMQVLYLDVYRTRTAEMPMVLFPHEKHTIWLECENCHEWLFKSKAGGTKFGMFDVLSGEFCGRCHGAVAFPLTECRYCHSVWRSQLKVPVKELELHK